MQNLKQHPILLLNLFLSIACLTWSCGGTPENSGNGQEVTPQTPSQNPTTPSPNTPLPDPQKVLKDMLTDTCIEQFEDEDLKDALKKLRAGEVDVNVKVTGDGYTILHLSVQDEKANEKLVEALIAAGAEVNAKDKDGSTPLYHILSLYGDEYDANIHPKIISVLLEQGKADPNIKATTDRKDTPLHQAVVHGADVVKLLLQHKADRSVKNSKGALPLHMAVIARNLGSVEALLGDDNFGINVVGLNNAGQHMTPLDFAIERGKACPEDKKEELKTIIQLLRDRGGKTQAQLGS